MSASIDWVTIAATFGAAIAGSWAGARATQRQTRASIRMEKERWYKECCFEFLEAADSFAHAAFNAEAMPARERDRLGRRLLSLAFFAVPEQLDSLQRMVQAVRHFHQGQPCAVTPAELETYFDDLHLTLIRRVKELDQQPVEDDL